MSDMFEMDVDQPMHASSPTSEVATRQRNLRHPKSMPILTRQSTADHNTSAHERLGYTSTTNEEDRAMESDAGTYKKRLRKTKNDFLNQSKDGYESDTDDHPQFRVRKRHDAQFSVPFAGAVAPPWHDNSPYFDMGSPDSATLMSEDEPQQRRKRVRVPSGADQTSVTSVSGMTERRPMKKLRASLP
ncbi:hypothetical protein BDZ89DRAFT_1065476 [Hymenopellis radicata]|nr:hypothetical protein BDZ89DRAFT_1065476 [Hymenopellis radicata]